MHQHHDLRATIPEDADTLRDVATKLELGYDRLRKARQRNPADFPTHWYRGERLHRPTEVAQYLGKTPRSRLRIRE